MHRGDRQYYRVIAATHGRKYCAAAWLF